MNAYGEIVKFEEGKTLKYPDFVLMYLGKRSIQGPSGAKFSMNYYYFEITSESVSKSLVWSSGTGRIVPKKFQVTDKSFALELLYSRGHKKHLQENQLIISAISDNK